jgi:uncharacterized protein YyaL (SSP411 family)
VIPGAAALVAQLVLAAAAAPSPSPRPVAAPPCAPWSADPFDVARRQERPVLIFLRYFACQACDSVQRPLLGPGSPVAGEYVCVKVDADDHPAGAAIYRAAAENMDGSAGWPVVALLLPDGRPFHAMTVHADAVAAFEDLALRKRAAYHADRKTVEADARRGLDAARSALEVHASGRPITAADTARAVQLLAAETPAAPEAFPPRHPRAAALGSLPILDALARGTLRDHVGGGFFHGTTPAEPGVPHFEKRLGDNALLLRAFARGYGATRNLLYRDVARDIVSWAVREMRDSSGDFWASVHPASEGRDGAYYVFSGDEVQRALGAERAAELQKSYRLVPPGVLVLTGNPFAGLGASQQVLFARRARRVRPPTDSRVMAGWNGLMISGLAASGSALAWGSDLETARRAADAVMARLGPASALRHSAGSPAATTQAVLEDYAYLAQGMLDLGEATGEPKWRAQAVALVDAAVSRFWDVAEGGFFITEERGLLPFRPRHARDGDLPSANAVLADVLLRLGRITGDARYTRLGEKTLEAFAEELAADPGGTAGLALVAKAWLDDRAAIAPRPSPR